MKIGEKKESIHHVPTQSHSRELDQIRRLHPRGHDMTTLTQIMTSPYLNNIASTLFHKFKVPSLKKYNGSRNLNDRIRNYNISIWVHKAIGPFTFQPLCTMLREAVKKWCNNLNSQSMLPRGYLILSLTNFLPAREKKEPYPLVVH